MVADAPVGNDGFGGHAGTPLHRRELPAARAKPGFQLGDAHLARANAHFRGIGTPVFQVNHALGRAHIARDDEGLRHLLLEIADHVLHAVGMPMGDVDGDVVRRQALGKHAVHRVVIRLFHPQRNRGEQALGLHVAGEHQVVQVKPVHHVKVAVLRQPFANRLVHHGFHVGGHHWQPELAPPQFYARVAFRAALHPAFAGQQEDVVVVKNFHGGAFSNRSKMAKKKPGHIC